MCPVSHLWATIVTTAARASVMAALIVKTITLSVMVLTNKTFVRVICAVRLFRELRKIVCSLVSCLVMVVMRLIVDGDDGGGG